MWPALICWLLPNRKQRNNGSFKSEYHFVFIFCRLLCAGSVVAWNYLLARLRAECPEHAETIVADNSEPMPARFGVDASPLESLGFANWTPIDQTINDSVESLKKHALL